MEERGHVLIVDDEEEFRGILRRILQPLDVHISECSDGADVLSACSAAVPDVILLDMCMPRLGGAETCRHVRAAEALKDVPIIILSGLGDSTSKVEALRAGAHDYITKPFDMEEVRARVCTHLELRRRGREIERQRAHLSVALEEARTLNRQLLKVNERLLASAGPMEGFFSTMRDLQANFAHPLKEMLREARELALDAHPGSRKAQAFLRIQETISALEHHLQNLAFAACLEAGEASLEEHPMDAGMAFQDLIQAFRDLHAPLGTGLEIGRLPEPGALVVPTDPKKARAILWNMLEFACERTPPGDYMHLDIRAEGTGFTLEVRAGGPPSTDVELAHFFAASHPGNPHSMLLPVARSLAELLGGHFDVLPRAEGGLELRCVLPAAIALEQFGPEGGDGFLAM